MTTKRLYLFLTILLTLSATSCWSSQPSLLDYTQHTSLCVGYVDSGIVFHIRGYSIPLKPAYAQIEALWHEKAQAIILKDKRAILHRIELGDRIGVEDFPNSLDAAASSGGSGLSLSNKYELAAFTIERRYADSIPVVQSFGFSTPQEYSTVSVEVYQPVLHPNKSVVSGIYYPEDEEHYKSISNIIGLYELLEDGNQQMQTYTVGDYAIFEVFGWSSNGEIIGFSQFAKQGVIPHFLFLDDGTVQRSSYQRGCANSAQWSPVGEALVYSGSNNTDQEWDLYLETVHKKSDNGSSLTRLTETPGEDELGAAWSHDGRLIVYSKASTDEQEKLYQDLFLISLDDPSHAPRQLTTTPDEYETNPMWISDHEIAYLSWLPDEPAWYLKSLSVANPNQTPVTILKLPESWYRAP